MKVWKNIFRKGDKINASEIAVAPGLMLPGAVIVESGSNANGDYVRFGDGTMICMGKTSVDGKFDGNLKWGSLYYLDAPVMDYPKPFISQPYTIPVSFTTLGIMFSTYNPVTTTHTPTIELVRPVTNPKVPITIGYVAIGRWK